MGRDRRNAGAWTWGITKGVEIFVRKVAPLGDPMALNVWGHVLSVRKGDTEMIEVQ